MLPRSKGSGGGTTARLGVGLTMAPPRYESVRRVTMFPDRNSTVVRLRCDSLARSRRLPPMRRASDPRTKSGVVRLQHRRPQRAVVYILQRHGHGLGAAIDRDVAEEL